MNLFPFYSTILFSKKAAFLLSVLPFSSCIITLGISLNFLESVSKTDRYALAKGVYNLAIFMVLVLRAKLQKSFEFRILNFELLLFPITLQSYI